MPQDISVTETAITDSTTMSVLAINNITKEREGLYNCYGDNSVTNVINSPENISVEVFVQGNVSIN